MTIVIGKIFVRSIIGILTAGTVTVLAGEILPTETLAAMYIAIGGYIYVDKEVSPDAPKI